MKNKLKHNLFLRTTAVLSVLSVILIMSAFVMFYYIFSIPEPEGLSFASWTKRFTNNFSTWIECKNGTVGVKEIGIKRLDDYRLWVQIVDETGREVFSHNKPVHYPEDYSIAELIAFTESKYENGNTIFISSVQISDRTLNYIIGFPYAIGKTMLYYNGERVVRLSPFLKKLLLFAACMIVVCTFFYTFWLSRKLSTITNSIRTIVLHNYKPVKEDSESTYLAYFAKRIIIHLL